MPTVETRVVLSIGNERSRFASTEAPKAVAPHLQIEMQQEQLIPELEQAGTKRIDGRTGQRQR